MHRELEEINRPMNEELFNNLEKKYQEVKRLTDYEQLLHIVNGVQDFGVVGGMGDIVSNEKLAKALSEQGCVIVKTTPNVRRKRYAEKGR